MTDQEKQNWIAHYYYCRGRISGIWDFAVWKNGHPVVGALERPYADVIAPIKKEMEDIRLKLKMTDCELTACEGCPDCRGIR